MVGRHLFVGVYNILTPLTHRVIFEGEPGVLGACAQLALGRVGAALLLEVVLAGHR
jgi:hypothetical protein